MPPSLLNAGRSAAAAGCSTHVRSIAKSFGFSCRNTPRVRFCPLAAAPPPFRCTVASPRHSPTAALRRRGQRAYLPRGKRSRVQVAPTAMINVDFASPSLVLGAGLIGCGVLLLQMRSLKRKISRDADIVIAAMISIVGSTLIFQVSGQ